MEENNLRRLVWIPVRDLSRLVATKPFILGCAVSREDMYRFYNGIVREVARKANMKFEEVKEVMDSENGEFLSYVDTVFGKRSHDMASVEVQNIKKLLLVPMVNVSLKSVISMYEQLAPEDQKRFRQYIIELN